jgi:hypothetical protein
LISNKKPHFSDEVQEHLGSLAEPYRFPTTGPYICKVAISNNPSDPSILFTHSSLRGGLRDFALRDSLLSQRNVKKIIRSRGAIPKYGKFRNNRLKIEMRERRTDSS